LAVTGLTALVAIEDTLNLKAGETIFIQGGAGGVASVAIQLAKHIGARVISTASAANHTYARGLGADEVIDYNAQDFTKAMRAAFVWPWVSPYRIERRRECQHQTKSIHVDAELSALASASLPFMAGSGSTSAWPGRQAYC